MSKRLVWLLGLLAITGFVACRSPAPTLESGPSATPVVPTVTPVSDTATPRPTATSEEASKGSSTPTPGWQIPEVRDSDWTKGADDAGLVIVEYSDFQ